MQTQAVATSQTSPKNHYRALSPGKLMGLKQITDALGKFKVLALDQSNSFKKSLRAMHERTHTTGEPTYEEIRDAKLEITSILSPAASAVLLDVNYGLHQALNAGSLARGVGLIGRVEASRDAGVPGELEPGWSVAQIKRMGCSAVKLLVYMDVEDAAYTSHQMRFVQQIHAECQREDILLMVEELSFPRQGEDKKSPAYASRRPRNIIESAKQIGPYCDVLKLEYPGEQNLKALNEAALRPWVLLSAGEKFDIFVKQVESAMKSGASGIMAGRAIFNEYFEQNTPNDRSTFLKTTGLQRMKILTDLVDRYAASWQTRLGLSAAELAAGVDPHWYSAKAGQVTGPTQEARGEY